LLKYRHFKHLLLFETIQYWKCFSAFQYYDLVRQLIRKKAISDKQKNCLYCGDSFYYYKNVFTIRVYITIRTISKYTERNNIKCCLWESTQQCHPTMTLIKIINANGLSVNLFFCLFVHYQDRLGWGNLLYQRTPMRA